MNNSETIGYCEACGVLDHHLQGGECPGCRHAELQQRMAANNAKQDNVIEGAITSRIHGTAKKHLLIRGDSSGNQVIDQVLQLGGAS